VIQIVSYAMVLVSITAVIRKGNGQHCQLEFVICRSYLAYGRFCFLVRSRCYSW